MKRMFRVEIEVVVDGSIAEEAVHLARDQYGSTGYAFEPICDGSEVLREIPPEEYIADVESAIMELIIANPLLEKVGIEVIGVYCSEGEPADAALL